MKFGGSSLADAKKIRHCATLAKDEADAVVVSAMGGTTDRLLELAAAPDSTTLWKELRQGHLEAAATLGADVNNLLDQLEHLLLGISAVGELTPRSRDLVLSFGERLSAELFAAALIKEGKAARAMTGGEAGIVTDDRFGEATPLMSISLYQMKERLSGGDLPVITGFLGATQHGVTTTLGRGGSDYTATLVGSALGADEIWIWSDVDGLLSADPRIVPEARLLEEVSCAEAIEMGQFGAKSMHPRALEPAAERGIPVRIRNTFRPEVKGTLIKTSAGEAVTRSVNLVKDASLLTIEGAAMVGHPGTAGRVFQALGAAGINIRMISQSVSEAGISLLISERHLEEARSVLESELLRTGAAREIRVEEEVAIVAIVGSNMRGRSGVAADVFGAIAERGINVRAIAQGSSELSISFVVPRASGPDAVKALHDRFEPGR
jgi:aspartate kinase